MTKTIETPIIKMEFHEKKSRNLIMPYIETQFHVTDIMEFLRWCDKDNEVKDWSLEWMEKVIAKMKTWKRPIPKFDHQFKGKTIYIYPKQNIVAVIECGIHYICQHSFDILPRKIKDIIYGWSEKGFVLGTLYSLKLPEMVVKDNDIADGFMNRRERNNVFGDSFPRWIQYRRTRDATPKSS